jgi:ABC-type transport system involved in cytochrome bd biosynthesis fused ATPase/permease subunit
VVLAQARIDDLMQRADSRAAERDVVVIASSRERLSVKDLGVTWTDREVVSNVNFEVQRGRISVLTGQSGSGKSSIAAAVLGLVEHAGEIRIDATVLPPLTERSAHITAMLQTTHVFTTSVRENIRVARPDVTDEEIVNALTAAGLDQWFATLDKGLDTVIGAAARGMSGGEIQRLGLARILVTQAPFVVLDEPTEHLDELTSRSVWSTIRQALSDRGVLLITHDRTLLDESMNIVEVPRG